MHTLFVVAKFPSTRVFFERLEKRNIFQVFHFQQLHHTTPAGAREAATAITAVKVTTAYLQHLPCQQHQSQ